MAVQSGMASMRPMEIWINIVASSQGPEGVPSSGDSGVCSGSGYIPRAGIQLVGKGGTEEEVKDNIPSSRRGMLDILRKHTSWRFRSLSQLRRHMR